MSAQAGTCDLCCQLMLLASDGDCWHPWNVERACPPEDVSDGLSLPAWGRPGRPGAQHFRPAPVVSSTPREASE